MEFSIAPANNLYHGSSPKFPFQAGNTIHNSTSQGFVASDPMSEDVAISKERNSEYDSGSNVNFNTQSHPETASVDPYETGEYLYTYWGSQPSDVLFGKHVQTQGNELNKTVVVKFNVVQVIKICPNVHILIWLKHI